MPTNTKAFAKLVAEPCEWLLSSYGRSHALGWRGEPETITLNHTLFANFDFDDTQPERPVPRLVGIHPKLSFINTSPERVRKTLSLYFYVNALLSDVPSESTWDEEKGLFEIKRDEELAQRLAAQDTLTFMRDHIKVESFVPAAEQPDTQTEYFSPFEAPVFNNRD